MDTTPGGRTRMMIVAMPNQSSQNFSFEIPEPESSMLAPRKTISTFSPSNSNSSISSVDMTLVFFRFK